MPENEIIKDIAKTLEILPGVYAWRNNTGAVKRGPGRYVRFGKKGSGDFLGLIKGGRFLAIEAKQPGENQSPDQVEFQEEVEALGGLYLLAESGPEIVPIITQAIEEEMRKNENTR